MRGLSDDERALVTHVSRFGSDGYPVRKLTKSRCWVWGDFRSVKGPPTTFKTKREAVASFEAFLDVLHEALGEEAQARAIAERDEFLHTAPISERHSINRVKRALAATEGRHTARAARLRIDCLKWLGRWGGAR